MNEVIYLLSNHYKALALEIPCNNNNKKKQPFFLTINVFFVNEILFDPFIVIRLTFQSSRKCSRTFDTFSKSQNKRFTWKK